jgi:hypothetical protein
MCSTYPLRIAKRGLLTLPKALRDTHNIGSGDAFTLLDLKGVFAFPAPVRDRRAGGYNRLQN